MRTAARFAVATHSSFTPSQGTASLGLGYEWRNDCRVEQAAIAHFFRVEIAGAGPSIEFFSLQFLEIVQIA